MHMAAGSGSLHEEGLSPGIINRHRATVSLMEELEAVDWYDQRVEATDDDSLAAVLAHNRDEEKEHAAMTLEWLRRHDPVLSTHLRTYLFTELPVTEVEKEIATETTAAEVEGSLGIGSLRGTEER
jgi:ferritin-like protein